MSYAVYKLANLVSDRVKENDPRVERLTFTEVVEADTCFDQRTRQPSPRGRIDRWQEMNPGRHNKAILRLRDQRVLFLFGSPPLIVSDAPQRASPCSPRRERR